ncbi:hypothetical protein KUTeg_003353 [Tegillarca granosa]|uniref:Uncharacterized protein n=1 Tax=Tegillarca granosa TaxID=220873 RepID=A0ABQ9FLX2_TEGGR|nr:hypothetical protein KUTeg_003353 [Tegillarca granosa]
MTPFVLNFSNYVSIVTNRNECTFTMEIKTSIQKEIFSQCVHFSLEDTNGVFLAAIQTKSDSDCKYLAILLMLALQHDYLQTIVFVPVGRLKARN